MDALKLNLFGKLSVDGGIMKKLDKVQKWVILEFVAYLMTIFCVVFMGHTLFR